MLCDLCRKFLDGKPTESFGGMLATRRRFLGLSVDQMLKRFGAKRYVKLVERAEAEPGVRLFTDEMLRVADAYELDLADLVAWHSAELDAPLSKDRPAFWRGPWKPCEKASAWPR